jgi:predicted component of type VI protein secretion system
MGKLVHFHADGSAAEIKLDRQRITIGRRPDNDFCLPYPAVSGEHAAVVTILEDSFLEDLGSTNGTLVNGTAVTKHFLRDRDEIDVGQQILIYVVDDAATLEAPRRKGKPVEDLANRESPDATLVGSAALRAKRRSDFVTPVPMPSPGVVPRVAANGDDASSAEGTAPVRAAPPVAVSTTDVPDAAAPAPAPPSPQRLDVEPALRVVSGAKAGRIVALVKDETLIGRAGVQVVALRRTPDELRVVPVEGASPPSVNGVEVVPEGQSLAVGDVLEIAGTRLEVIAATKRISG